jgi:hypothetical protein
LGFHTYLFEEGDPERRWVLNFSSWISPGIFGGGLQDVTVLSHEIAETYNDPFVVADNVHNLTPWWLAPNGNCQNNLETGDVIANLPNGVFPVLLIPSAERSPAPVVRVFGAIGRVGWGLQLSQYGCADAPISATKAFLRALTRELQERDCLKNLHSAFTTQAWQTGLFRRHNV